MGRLTPVLVALLVAGCASAPPKEGVPDRLSPGVPVAQAAALSRQVALPEGPAGVRVPGPTPVLASGEERPPTWISASSPDVEAWPSGPVADDQAARLGLPPRFWTDQRGLWHRALDPWTPAAAGARLLETVLRASHSDDEVLRAIWHLWTAYSKASLGAEARQWLDRAAALSAAPVINLDRAWDQAYRLGDLEGAKTLWVSGASYPDPADQAKARILRRHLFGGTRSLAPLGADDYVSTLVLDNDDLWAGTWNGSVVRWSLATGQADLVLKPSLSVAPVKTMAATAWFLYAFQDQGFLRYSKVTGTWRSFDYPEAWNGLRIQSVVPAGDEFLWVATLGQGLWTWDQGRWTLVDDQGGGPFLNALCADGRGGFWVGTKDRGLWNWNDGVWTSVAPAGISGPSNVSVVAADPAGGRWAIGTWGEGTWLLDEAGLRPVSGRREFVTAAAWDRAGPVWATLDEGLISGQGREQVAVGPLDGLTSGGVSSLVTRNGRWIWGSTGQGLGWWTEHEDPALLR